MGMPGLTGALLGGLLAMVALVAVARRFGLFSHRNAGRADKQKMHWVPMAIGGFFAFLVVFNIAFMTISSHGLADRIAGWLLPNPDNQRLHTASPGVIPHDRNNLYEPQMQRIEAQRALGWQVDIDGLDRLRSGTPGSISVHVRDATGKPVRPDRVEVSLLRMANSDHDRQLQLKPAADGGFAGDLVLPDPGRWVFEFTLVRGQDTFVMQHSLSIEAAASPKP